MASKLGTVESLMECPICLGDFTDPRILPCFHTLCKGCLESHVSASAQGDKFSCPSCRQECRIPTEGLSAVPKNFFLNSVREFLEGERKKSSDDGASGQSTADSEDRLCDNAKFDTTPHGKVTSFCAVCAEFYCEACASSHRRVGVSRAHKLRPAAEVDVKELKGALKQTKIPNCDQHPEAKLHLYCDTCQVPVCATCCMLTHQQHKYRELAAMGEECQDKLTGHSKTAAGHIITLDKHTEDLEASQTNIQRDATRACEEVRQAADELRSLVTKREQHLIKQIREEEKRAVLEVKAVCKETELNKASMQSLQSYIQDLQVSGDITEQVIHTPAIQEQLHQQLSAPLRTVSWTASFKKETKSVAVLDAILGTVSTESSVVATKPVAAGGSAMDVVQMKLGAPLSTLICPLSEWVVGPVVVGDCVCVTGYYGSGLWIHNTATNTSQVHALKGLRAKGMIVLHKGTDNTLVITDENNKLHFVRFNQNTMDITTHTVSDITFVPGHISIHPVTGQLVIADNTNRAIVTCDTQGNIQNSIKVQTGVGTMMCAVATDDGFVILDHSDPGRVHWADSQGRVTNTYGQGDGEGLGNPWHMVRGSQGQLVVADTSNNRLHLVDASGQLSCYLLTDSDGIQHPHCMWLDETTSLLYVAHGPGFDAEICVYKWPAAAPLPPLRANSTCTHHTLQVRLPRYK